ncbi:MAG: hypothetical protein H7301_06915 [Cryobacterium sp.]|nr:hypothetical protein [Oligoflexia bacterium]
MKIGVTMGGGKNGEVCRALWLGTLLLQACGAHGVRQMTPVQEAYRLMDQGENAKAVVVLEDSLARNTSDPSDAHQLLASAYVGLAGIDIYKIQEAFQDILFRKSLRDEVNSKPMRADVVLAIKLGAKKLVKADGAITKVLDATNLTEGALALENSQLVFEGESRLRKALGCPIIPD